MTADFDHSEIELTLGGQAAAQEVQPYDIEADKQALVASLDHSQEIEDLTATIDISDMSTIATFGWKTAEEISKVSDAVLRSMNMSQLDDSGVMMQALARIMDQFKSDELKNKTSVLDKLFGNPKKQIDRILDKYTTMGDEVDKIYIQLKQYEREITEANRKLEQMFEANVGYFHELEKYIVAGDQGCREISDYIAVRESDLKESGDQSINFELQTLRQALDMLRARTQDLRTAEVVALQSIPMLKMLQYTNMTLVRKINSAFIVTLPVFKQALAQAIMMKRQKLQADALSQLERRTNEMILKNAGRSAEQAGIAAHLNGGSAASTQTLEESRNTIVSGIGDVKKLSEETRAQRMRDTEKLEAIKRDFAMKYNAGAAQK